MSRSPATTPRSWAAERSGGHPARAVTAPHALDRAGVRRSVRDAGPRSQARRGPRFVRCVPASDECPARRAARPPDRDAIATETRPERERPAALEPRASVRSHRGPAAEGDHEHRDRRDHERAHGDESGAWPAPCHVPTRDSPAPETGAGGGEPGTPQVQPACHKSPEPSRSGRARKSSARRQSSPVARSGARPHNVATSAAASGPSAVSASSTPGRGPPG